MRRRFSIFFGMLAVSAPLAGRELCVPHQTTAIEAEARCSPQEGISINVDPGNGTVADCLRDKHVQTICGPDGRLTRLRAYTAWLNQLKRFEDQCALEGGAFSFEDTDFAEPANESFCPPAVVEITSNMFEETLCNYRSVCPPVKVVCDRPCPE
jgi:hypothetical protein